MKKKPLERRVSAAQVPDTLANNELIGDDGIISPASDEKTAKQRMQQYECYDWWFCHKKL